MVLGSVLLLVLLGAVRYVLAGSSRIPQQLLIAAVGGAAAMYMCAFMALEWINVSLDLSAGVERRLKVVGAQVSDDDSTTEYYLHVQDDDRSTVKIEVPGAVYEDVTIGGFVQFKEHPGRLGYRWISRLRVEPAAMLRPPGRSGMIVPGGAEAAAITAGSSTDQG
jgi:hypothetical protein